MAHVFARVDVRRRDGSPPDDATAWAVDGATSDFGLCTPFPELREMGLLGGRAQLRYDPDAGHFWAGADLESAAPLAGREVECLKERAGGDWSDGVTAAFFEYLGESRGLDVRVRWRDPLMVCQFPRRGRRFVPWSGLAGACCRGDPAAARAALDAGEDVGASPEGLPVLHYAIVGGHVAVAELLLDRGADVDGGDGLWPDRTPLRTCVTSERRREGSVRIARMLLERGADPSRGFRGTCLDVARRRGWDPMVRLLEGFAGSIEGLLARPGAELRVGDRVRIGRGVWAGQVGVVERGAGADHPGSAKIRFRIFGRDVVVGVPLDDIWSPPTPDGPRPPG